MNVLLRRAVGSMSFVFHFYSKLVQGLDLGFFLKELLTVFFFHRSNTLTLAMCDSHFSFFYLIKTQLIINISHQRQPRKSDTFWCRVNELRRANAFGNPIGVSTVRLYAFTPSVRCRGSVCVSTDEATLCTRVPVIR